MFTGIVEETGVITEISEGQLGVRANVVLDGTKLGDSICVSGACLTVIRIDQDGCLFDVMPETFDRTNLKGAKVKGVVNLERAMLFNGRVGGHLVQGHVDGTGTINSQEKDGEALLIKVATDERILGYIVEKGFVAVDGVSLTVVDCDLSSFMITLVPHTMANTTFKVKNVGDTVNIEVDILAKYMERFSKQYRMD